MTTLKKAAEPSIYERLDGIYCTVETQLPIVAKIELQYDFSQMTRKVVTVLKDGK